MFQRIIKNLPIKISAVLFCVSIVFGFYIFLIKADSDAKVQFTADTILSLTGITDGDLYIANTSECDELNISGSTLTVSDIPAGSDFILKTSSHNNALKLTPSDGAIGLTFTSSHLSSGNITQWALNSSVANATVNIIAGVPQLNRSYLVKVDGTGYDYYFSNNSGEIEFAYSGGFSNKTFTIEQGDKPKTPFVSPSSPTDISITINNNESETSSKIATLSLCAENAAQMAISNSFDFEGISWGSWPKYSPTKTWQLSEGEGTKTVYVKFRSKEGGVSRVVSDSIILKNISESISDIPGGSLIQMANDYKIYIVKGNYKRHIINGRIFDFYGHLNWNAVKEANQSQINIYQNSSLVQSEGDYKVYEINGDGTRHWINMAAGQFQKTGRKWEMIYLINQKELDFYKTGADVMFNFF